MKRYAEFSASLPPAVIRRIRDASRATRVPAAAIARAILTEEAIDSWEQARVPAIRMHAAIEEAPPSRRLLSESAGDLDDEIGGDE